MTDNEIRKKRILMRATHRGIKEMDVVIGGYAKRHLPDMGLAELDRLETLMDESDQDLLSWVIGQADVPTIHQELITLIREDAKKHPAYKA